MEVSSQGAGHGYPNAFCDIFSLDWHVPADHLLRAIDRFVDLSAMREHTYETTAGGTRTSSTVSVGWMRDGQTVA